MGRRLRNLILIVLAAVVGSALGRYAAQMHARIDAGEDPLGAEFEFDLRPQELVPGFIAAFRIGEPPWSWLHIPSWLAAFATNFAVAAVGGDLDRLRENIEQRAMGLFGLETEREVEIHDVTPIPPDAPTAPPAPQNPASPPAADRTPGGSSSTTWTTGNATPSDGDRNDESEASGFTPFAD